jgi:hypothetical protein
MRSRFRATRARSFPDACRQKDLQSRRCRRLRPALAQAMPRAIAAKMLRTWVSTQTDLLFKKPESDAGGLRECAAKRHRISQEGWIARCASLPRCCPIVRLELLSKARLTANKPRNSRLSGPTPPPPPLFVLPAVLALVNSTCTCALAAGGAPEHVIA